MLHTRMEYLFAVFMRGAGLDKNKKYRPKAVFLRWWVGRILFLMTIYLGQRLLSGS